MIGDLLAEVKFILTHAVPPGDAVKNGPMPLSVDEDVGRREQSGERPGLRVLGFVHVHKTISVHDLRLLVGGAVRTQNDV